MDERPTPRTDAAILNPLVGEDALSHRIRQAGALADISRQLERELSEAREKLEKALKRIRLLERAYWIACGISPAKDLGEDAMMQPLSDDDIIAQAKLTSSFVQRFIAAEQKLERRDALLREILEAYAHDDPMPDLLERIQKELG